MIFKCFGIYAYRTPPSWKCRKWLWCHGRRNQYLSQGKCTFLDNIELIMGVQSHHLVVRNLDKNNYYVISWTFLQGYCDTYHNWKHTFYRSTAVQRHSPSHFCSQSTCNRWFGRNPILQSSCWTRIPPCSCCSQQGGKSHKQMTWKGKLSLWNVVQMLEPAVKLKPSNRAGDWISEADWTLHHTCAWWPTLPEQATIWGRCTCKREFKLEISPYSCTWRCVVPSSPEQSGILLPS